ncbi:bifunctional glutamate N-acetyltransferase/amino-acid acetyltransferase ArgJ [Marinomonas agarivorans]|nr:bifunctional glutamate N-acetyltransferase/amino-acid acetyltransferase ArgJ [Marinomonas agarivorans]
MAVGVANFPDMPQINGLRFGVTEAGVKYADRKDLVVFEICEGASVAGVFTKNAFCAAPVTVAKEHLAKATPRFLIVNTGNANAGTGEQGLQDALSMCSVLAEIEGQDITCEQVLPFSTGVIGETLPIEKIAAAIPKALSQLEHSTWFDVATGIMTTDTRPKAACRTFSYKGKVYSLAGVSKGAGMIKPNMATMLAYVATDINIAPSLLQDWLQQTTEKSFNRITIDSDTSTNDACILIATGKAGNTQISSIDDELGKRFFEELMSIMQELAQAIVRDGEGATKFVEISVEQASSTQEALNLAFNIAHSPLVKTALFASDPNWGRILAVVGRSDLPNLEISKVQITLNGVCIVENGARAMSYTEEAGQKAMSSEEINITVSLGRSQINESVWTTDLSHEYVSVNADYRS